MPCSSPRFITILFFLFTSLLLTQAAVPSSKTFKYTNNGDFGEYIVEYDASYRVLSLYTFPFQLCFFNTTPNAYTLALRMGVPRSESVMRWVWEANRDSPVHENATFTFGPDGNLVLAEADGTVVWQTGTANKGVVGLNLLGNGNIVLYDKKGKFVWQSFDYPTDTLLVGQAFRSNGPSKIVSRLSDIDGSDGLYSLLIEGRFLSMYFKSKNSKKPLLYYRFDEFGNGEGSLASLLLQAEPETEGAKAFEVRFSITMNNSTSSGTFILARPKYNGTYSFLRIESDGNLKVYTYDENVDYGAWEETLRLFDRDEGRESECKLPRRCGSLGVCEADQCVACPTAKGLLGWSKGCAPPKLPPCKGGAKVVDYYKVVGVESFLNGFNEGNGPITVVECRAKCDKDCGCLGFFYKEESSKCLLAPELGTLTRVSNSSHVVYIKTSK